MIVWKSKPNVLSFPSLKFKPALQRFLACGYLSLVNRGALVFAGVGWYTVYNNAYDARIVGGDAYNFIIYATRGTALVCVGIVCAVLIVTFAIFNHTAKRTP